MDDRGLKIWAEQVLVRAEGGDASVKGAPLRVAMGVLRLLGELAARQKQIEGHCERIAKQSDLLSRKAERIEVPS